MKKTLIALAVLALLSGCAGMNTAWRFQMDWGYMTPQDKPEPAPIPKGKEL
jgi:hypothetical protein